MQLQGFIFDFNGTLLWDTALHNRAWDIFLEKHGLALSDEEKSHAIHGKMNCDILPAIFGEALSSNTITRYANEKESIYRDICSRSGIGLAPGSEWLLNQLMQKGVRCAIATASPEVNVRYYIQRFNLYRWFEPNAIVFDNGTFRSKPHPDLFIEAAKQLELDPSLCAIAEDSRAGIAAATAAGAGKIYHVNSLEQINPIIGHNSIDSFHQVDLDLF